MKIPLSILKNSKDLLIHYIDEMFIESDTETEVYDKCKIAILLTDNLIGILDDKLIGGKKGDILIFNPDEIHFGRFLKQGNYRFLEVYIPLSFFEDNFCGGSYLMNIFTDNSENRINCIRGNPAEKEKAMENAEKIIKLINENNPDKNVEIFMHILKILTLISELYNKYKNASVSDSITHPHVIYTIKYISKHYSDKIKIEDITSLLGCSEAYLSRLFKKYVGISVYNYILEYRINMAKKFLKSDCSVTEVCYLTGFNDCSNFIGKFKKITGMTPYQYKNVIQKSID